MVALVEVVVAMVVILLQDKDLHREGLQLNQHNQVTLVLMDLEMLVVIQEITPLLVVEVVLEVLVKMEMQLMLDEVVLENSSLNLE